MADYYTLETVKSQLLQIGGTIDPNHAPKSFPPTWKYCPCRIEKKCIRYNKVICNPPIYVGVYVKPPRRGIPLIIEIIYERETKKGFIRVNNLKLNALIGKGKIDQQALRRVTKPF